MEIELHLPSAPVVREISHAIKEINKQRSNDQKRQLKNMSKYLSKRSK